MSKETYQGERKKIAKFVEDAIGEGALERNPQTERNQNIGIISSVTNTPLHKIGEIFPDPTTGKPTTENRIREVRRKFLSRLYKHSSPELQATIPLGILHFRERRKSSRQSYLEKTLKAILGEKVKAIK